LDKKFVIEKIKEAAIEAFNSVRQEQPDINFCAYGLYSDTDAITICPAQNSCIHLNKMIENDPDDKEYYRWSPSEWSHESKGGESFNEISTYLRAKSKLIKSSDEYDQFKFDVYQSCILALKSLKDEGFFCDMDRNGVIVFTISDAINSNEHEWIELLNSNDASQQFNEWIKTLQ
jgi:hypothetical protein